MNIFLSFLLSVLSFNFLVACNEVVQESESNSPRALFSKKPEADVTKNSVNGYWELRYNGDRDTDSKELWRLKIQEDRLSIAVQCLKLGQTLISGGSIPVESIDQGDRVQLVFGQSLDFRTSRQIQLENEDKVAFECGGSLLKQATAYLYVDGYRLEVKPLFNDQEFEKIADIEEE